MSRAQRLLELIQVLRQHRRPVSGATLADALSISVRTLYRDIDTLKAQGASIDGEPGVGFVLRPGFMLPPLMFSESEIEALYCVLIKDSQISGNVIQALQRRLDHGAIRPYGL